MQHEIIDYFIDLYQEDYAIMGRCLERLNQEQLWRACPEGVSVANLTCHVIEMEKFWIEAGLLEQPFARNRQHEFERADDLPKETLYKLLFERRDKTLSILSNLNQEQWKRERSFHGDTFTGQGILMWHCHHIGLHRGHIEVHSRWLSQR